MKHIGEKVVIKKSNIDDIEYTAGKTGVVVDVANYPTKFPYKVQLPTMAIWCCVVE